MNNQWMWNDQPITNTEQLPYGTIGFIYMIQNTKTNQYYIGKKFLYKGGNWLTYWSSSADVKESIKKDGQEYFRRWILKPCNSAIDLTYYEMAHIVMADGLVDPNCWNKNILGKFFRGRIHS